MPLKVIGAGLSRTGTLSLKFALEQLGFGPCYHMVEYIPTKAHHAFWDRAGSGEYVNFEEVFKDYASCTDSPGNVFYKELAQFYPEAKVILSVRDPESWFRSITGSIMRKDVTEMLSQTRPEGLLIRTYWQLFGGKEQDRDFMLERFARWTDEVRRAIPPERLLIYDVREGWEPLCRFLGVEVPQAPFPRANAKEEFEDLENPRGFGAHILAEHASAVVEGWKALKKA